MPLHPTQNITYTRSHKSRPLSAVSELDNGLYRVSLRRRTNRKTNAILRWNRQIITRVLAMANVFRTLRATFHEQYRKQHVSSHLTAAPEASEKSHSLVWLYLSSGNEQARYRRRMLTLLPPVDARKLNTLVLCSSPPNKF